MYIFNLKDRSVPIDQNRKETSVEVLELRQLFTVGTHLRDQ